MNPYEVVEYRNCNGGCGVEGCNEEKQTVLFQHKSIEECRDFMLRFPNDMEYFAGSIHFRDDKNKMDFLLYNFFNVGGTHITRHLKVQKILGDKE